MWSELEADTTMPKRRVDNPPVTITIDIKAGKSAVTIADTDAASRIEV